MAEREPGSAGSKGPSCQSHLSRESQGWRRAAGSVDLRGLTIWPHVALELPSAKVLGAWSPSDSLAGLGLVTMVTTFCL